jgi:hypothetical protein
MKYVERKKTPPAGIPPGVEPSDSFRDERETRKIYASRRAVKKN